MPPAMTLLILSTSLLAAGCLGGGQRVEPERETPPRPMPEPEPFDLRSFEYARRPLLVFAPLEHPGLVEQDRLLGEENAGLIDRDMVIVTVASNAGGSVRHPARDEGRRISAEDARALRDRFGVPVDDFAVVLVGKDGTEKKRWDEPVEMEPVFELIDAMPMRRREMGER